MGTKKRSQAELLAEILEAHPGPRSVVGLDLSMTRPGFATVRAYEEALAWEAWHIETAPDSTVYGSGRTQRVDEIVAEAAEACMTADLVVLEGPFAGVGNHDGFVLNGAFHHEMWRRYGPNGPTVVEVAPTSLKKFATGSGRADKSEMALAAARRLGWTGTVNDEADALWLAHLGWFLFRRPKVDLPKAHLDGLSKIVAGLTFEQVAA